MNIRYYTLQTAVCIAVAAIFIFSSCDKEAGYESANEEIPGITFSLSIEQDEVTSGQMTRATGTAEMPIKQMKYIIKKKVGESGTEIVNASQASISPDFSKLTIEGLEEGEYAIVFYATTQSDESIPQPSTDGTLTNPYNDKPLDVDYLFGRVEFAVDGIKGEIAQPIHVNLKRCVGQVKIELKGSYYERRLITGVELSVINTDDITAKHLDYESGYADNLYSTITNLSLSPDKTEFYSFPSKPGTTLMGTIKISSVLLDGNTPSTKTYMFNDLKIEEGKISRIQLNWITPDANGVVYAAREDLNPTNSYEMFQKGEAEVKILKRTFYTDKPFKIELDADKKLHTAFYGPVNLHDVKVMCRMKAYSNEFFPIAYYEEYPAFYETWMELPVITKETTFRTESGKSLTIPAQPELLAKDCEFKIVNNDKYMQNIGKIKNPIKIIFYHNKSPGISGQLKTSVYPRYGRMACILAVNLSAFFDSKEFEDGVKNYKGSIPLVADTAHWDRVESPEEIIRRARMTKNLTMTELHWVDDPRLGHVAGAASPELGNSPAATGFKGRVLEAQFGDSPNPTHKAQLNTILHEWGHTMWYDHCSTFCGYKSQYYAWQNCCIPVMDRMFQQGALPVNTKREVQAVLQAAGTEITE